MKFINRGSTRRIRIGSLTKCVWKTIEHGEIINLDESLGLRYGFEKVTDSNQELPKITEGQIGDKKVETKQIDNTEDYTPDDLFYKELIKIKGVGPKMAKDIVVWGTKEKLIEQINLNAELPFRDDIEIKLKEKYGK